MSSTDAGQGPPDLGPGPAPAGAPDLARYEILEILGSGAMGVVYRARDRELERVVAIKTIRPDGRAGDEEYAAERKRLIREATAAARLNHPGIVAIHDVVLVGDVPHVVMEYVKGRTLAQLLATGPLSVDRAVGLVWQVCRALEYAHGEGVVHRDIKTSNIIVDATGMAKLGDFGVARIADKQATQTSGVVGTPAYLAPEQLQGRGADELSDLFSLAVVLYEVVTGRSPFPGDDVATVLYEIAHGEPLPARECNPAVSPALDAVIKRALSKAPEDRYPSASALADALEQALADPGNPWTSSWRPGQWSARTRRAVAASVIALVAVGVGVVTTTIGARPRGVVEVGPRMPVAILRGAPAGATISGVPPVQAVRPGPDADRPPPAPRARGTIVVETDPSVEVAVDGVARGRIRDRPLVVRDLPAGHHEVTLRLGDRERTLSGKLRGGQTLTFTYAFAPRPEVAAGRVAAGPPRPEPVARAREAPTSPRPVQGPAPADSRPPVAPKVEATVAPAAAPREAPAPRVAAAPRESFGCLSVNAVPFATVYVDGRRAGDTPRACLRVRTGSRIITFESPQGRSPERTVVVTAEHTTGNPLRLSYDFHIRQFVGP